MVVLEDETGIKLFKRAACYIYEKAMCLQGHQTLRSVGVHADSVTSSCFGETRAQSICLFLRFT